MNNHTLVRAYTKRQRTVETSTYNSELIGSRIAAELVMEYCYALRSLGVEIDGPTLMLGDNNAVVLNTTLSFSQRKKKHQAISYHRVRKAIAAGILGFRRIPSWSNYADVMTKSVSAHTFYSFIKPILFLSSRKEMKIPYFPMVAVQYFIELCLDPSDPRAQVPPVFESSKTTLTLSITSVLFQNRDSSRI